MTDASQIGNRIRGPRSAVRRPSPGHWLGVRRRAWITLGTFLFLAVGAVAFAASVAAEQSPPANTVSAYGAAAEHGPDRDSTP